MLKSSDLIAFNPYTLPGTRFRRNGKRFRAERPEALWDKAIQRHRIYAHNGERDEACPACQEMERKQAEDRRNP